MSEISTADMLSDKELPDLDPETPEDEPAEATGETEEQETEAQAEESSPDAKEDDSTPESVESKPDEESWTFKAVKDERAKRQAAEARLKELESKLGDSKPEADKPDWFGDPESAANAQEQRMQAMLFEQRAVIGQEMMREKHPDFDEMETRFFQMLEKDPQLHAGLMKASNPAKFAYETAKKALEYERMQDIDSYKAQIEAEIRSKVEAELKAKVEAEQSNRAAKEAAILPTLSNASSKGGLKSNDWSGPTSLGDILK